MKLQGKINQEMDVEDRQILNAALDILLDRQMATVDVRKAAKELKISRQFEKIVLEPQGDCTFWWFYEGWDTNRHNGDSYDEISLKWRIATIEEKRLYDAIKFLSNYLRLK